MFKDELSIVPKQSGCYLMKDKFGIIIYVGKAKNLFNRLKSYFNGRVTGKTALLVSEINSFEYIVTNNELEAFILELNLIKKHNPKYNIMLKDDKSYPYIELTNETYPRLIIRRELNLHKKHLNIYGPYKNAYAARRLVNLLNRLYPLRKCKYLPKKPCLYYYIEECKGYCINKNIDTSDMKSEILKILSGNYNLLIKKINNKIQQYSNALNYEKALELKNELEYIKIIFNEQKVELNDGIDRDIINYYINYGYISIEIFFVRNGKLIATHSNIKPIVNDEKEELESYIGSFYSKRKILPKEIIVPDSVDNILLTSLLNIKTYTVSKGNKKKLFNMAYDNAKINLENKINLISKNEQNTNEALSSLKELLKLEKLNIIEAFDNSNLFGTYTVSGMVVFKNGLPSKKDYRKYKTTFDKNDDVGSMKEVIYRRYYKILMENLEMPDLILVDGGINQINACKSVLDNLNINIKICGIKKNSKHSACELIDGNTYKSYDIDKSSNLFHFITRINEEVHNYTINYHKTIRSKGTISSLLDNVSGIGEIRKKKLINKYGSINKIKDVPIDELKKILPHDVAQNLYNYLKTI